MTRVVVHHSIDRLAADMADIPARSVRGMVGVVRDGIRTGNVVAQDFARRSAGAHGKRYPNAFSAEMRPVFEAFGTRIISGEYGPDVAKPQGGMSFEFGSRNQKPHLDLARSADLMGGSLARETGDMVDRLFW